MADIIRTVRDIDTADRVVLRVTDPASGREQSLTSFVDGVTEEGILVSVPQQVGPRISFRQDSLVAVSIWKGHAAHCFPSRIVGFNDGPPPQLILSSPRSHEIERKPRRGYFRVNVTIPVQMHLHGGIVQNATMLDLSAGGCRILTPKEVDDERLEYLDFDLPFPPDSDHLDQIRPLRRIRGHISGTAVFGSGASAPASSFAVSIGFEGLAGVARDVIMRYVAYRQRQLAHPERAPAAAPGPTQPAGDLPDSARERTA
ncbi:MAG: flagellar brake protein, partial [Chloroflexi bacterium]|nr:flagellar brake protein [Chloroflexota bacterium]